MTDQDFLGRLADCSLPPEDFNHRAHVRAAYLVLAQAQSFGGALDHMRQLITRYAAHIGKAGLYHETITVAFMALINARAAQSRHGPSWEVFAAENPDLFSREILMRRYDVEVLKSDLAREVFLLPG